MPIVSTLPPTADRPAGGFDPHQVVAAMRIQKQRRVLLADNPGLGKTLSALLALELDGQFTRRSNILITTAMTPIVLTWAPEVRKRIETQYNVVIADLTESHTKQPPSLAQRETRLRDRLLDANAEGVPLIVLANFEMLRRTNDKPSKVPTLFAIDWDAFLIDESHLVLPTNEDRPMMMTDFWRGLTLLRFGPDPIILPMSGTPDRGKLENRYGTWKALYPDFFTEFWPWARRNFIVTDEVIERKDKDPIQFASIGKIVDPAKWVELDARLMIRRTKGEVFTNMPEKQWAADGGVELPLTVSQRQAYEDYQAEIAEKYENMLLEGRDQEAMALRMHFALRARQLATCQWSFDEVENPDGTTSISGTPIVAGPSASNKLAWLLDFLEERGHTKKNWDPTLGKVVIVSSFVKVLEWLRAELKNAGIWAEVLSGDTSANDKRRIEESFQRGPLRVVLLSVRLGVSINLDAADDLVFTDLPYDPDQIEQAEDRIHRASRFHQVTYWNLLSIDTIDQVIALVVNGRYKSTRSMMDGARGVSIAKKLLPAEFTKGLAA